MSIKEEYNLFDILLIIFAVTLSILLLREYADIILWQHDSAYYDYKSLFLKIKFEGRWLTPYLSLIYKPLDGRIVVFLNLVFLFVFAFTCALRVTQRKAYSFIFASLLIQIAPAHYLLLWPVVIATATMFLVLAVMLAKRMPLLPFYCLFGLFFFATASNFYYLLPLVHLPLLASENVNSKLASLWLKIIPAWAIGFIFGYVVMQIVVYWYSGSIGLEVMQWRSPNPIQNWSDIVQNTTKSFNFLIDHLTYFFANPVTIIFTCVAFFINYVWGSNRHFLVMLNMCAAMLLVHYVVAISLGIDIAIRTVFATWISLLTLVFLSPYLNRKQSVILSIAALAVATTFFIDNKRNLGWYTRISNAFHQDFMNSLPDNPARYKGVIFISDNLSTLKTNQALIHKHDIKIGKIPWLNTDTRWATSAVTAGFHEVLLCGSTDHQLEICRQFWRSLDEIKPHQQTAEKLAMTFNTIVGYYQGYIVMRTAHERFPIKAGWEPRT